MMINRRKTLKLATTTVRLLATLMLLVGLAPAHDGLHEQIADVTARIKRAPQDANLYLKRGELYRSSKLAACGRTWRWGGGWSGWCWGGLMVLFEPGGGAWWAWCFRSAPT